MGRAAPLRGATCHCAASSVNATYFITCGLPGVQRAAPMVSLVGLRRPIPPKAVSGPPRHLLLSSKCRGTLVAAAAMSAGAYQAEGLGGMAGLRQRAQQLLVSPHDKEIWAVALPALVAMLLEPVMNAVNAGLVGHLGTQQLSAVSLGSLAVSFVTFLFSFLVFLTVPEIAAAVVKKDAEEVSCIAAKSLWIAVVCGFSSGAVLYCSAGAIVGALNPPEAAVAAYAADYIRVRAVGIPAALLGFVATGVFRGFKDTRTPLVGAVASAGVSLGLNVLLLYVLRMGVAGAAAATTAAQWVSTGLLLAALLGGGKVYGRHLTRPPPLSAVLPTLQLGAVLGVRNIISFGMVLYASTLCIRMGSLYQASFEVIRQIWILTIQFFECLNVATQALCATYLGNGDVATARSLLDRLLVLGSTVGLLAGVAVWAAHGPLVGFFTRDPMVVAQAVAALPLICALFPVDAGASIMDGSLLAAKQSNYMSVVQIAGSAVQYGVLAYLAATGNAATLHIWGALKILSFARLIGGAARNYASPKSAYLVAPAPHPPSAVAAHPAHAPAPAPAPAAAVPAVAAAAHAPARAPTDGGAEAAAAFRPHLEGSASTAAGGAAAADGGRIATAARLPEQLLVSPSARSVSTSVPAAPGEGLPGPLPPLGKVATAEEREREREREQAAALSSFEEDVVAMACAACTAATDMRPEMLALRRRGSSGGASISGAVSGASGGAGGGGGGGGTGAGGAEVGPSSHGAGVVGADEAGGRASSADGIVVAICIDLGTKEDGGGNGLSGSGEGGGAMGGEGVGDIGRDDRGGNEGARQAVPVGAAAQSGGRAR